jgi:hypothetical protein
MIYVSNRFSVILYHEEKRTLDALKKIVIVLFVIIVLAYFLYGSHGEGDLFFVFYEVPACDTINSTIIHLENKDIINVRGVDV